MKRELSMRLAVAGFLQETLQEMAIKKANAPDSDKGGAQEVLDFLQRAKAGETLPTDSIVRIARSFKDELTLANIARPQLLSMCQYMGIPPYGSEPILRFQLRNKFRAIKEDDRRIMWEGPESLSTAELREACQERGMRATGLHPVVYRRQLQEWLQLSVHKSIPTSLLIMSRAFMLTSSAREAEQAIGESLGSLGSDIVNEVVVASATPAEESSPEITKRKLESLQFQQEMIADERESELAATDAPEPLPAQEDSEAGSPQLTAAQAQALGDLARESGVEREKAELALLQASAMGRGGRDVDGDMGRVGGVLDQLLARLQARIDVTDKTLGRRLHLLDQDCDGELTAAELKQAAKTLLSDLDDAAADELVQRIDTDRDGRVSVIEILRYAEKRRQSQEMDAPLEKKRAKEREAAAQCRE